MAKKEVKTDLWVYDLLKEAEIELTPQGCDVKEIDEALKTASKRKPGNEGVVIGDFGEKARLLFEQERISEGHYVELLNLLK